MAKAPQPGRAKTRLCPPLLPTQAAELSAAFLRDITENIALAARAAPIHGCIAYAPIGAKGGSMGILPRARVLCWPMGRRRCRATCRALADACCMRHRRCSLRDSLLSCLVNSDSPTLPTAFLLQAAHALLSPGERVVLGPAEDGGYYLLGMKQPHAHLFADIAWSTRRASRRRHGHALSALGLDVVTLPTWYDVDDAGIVEPACH